MNIDKLLTGFYGEEAARGIFEFLCGLFVLNKTKHLNYDMVSIDEIIKSQKIFLSNTNCLDYEDNNLHINKNVFHMQTRQGDGGLDILVELDNFWIVYQCKFFTDKLVESKKQKNKKNEYTKTSRITQIENSFDTAIKTANKLNKKIIKWVLCVPRDLNDLEKQWFDDFKNNNRDTCKEIEFIGNLQLSDWLIQNEKIMNHYFRGNQSKVSELDVFKKFKRYKEGFTYDLINAYSPSARSESCLNNPKEIYLFFEHIKGFKEQFYKVLDLFLEIDERANLNKEQYEAYKTNLMAKDDIREKHGDNIDKEAKKIEKLTKKENINEYKSFLKKINENFFDYFSKI